MDIEVEIWNHLYDAHGHLYRAQQLAPKYGPRMVANIREAKEAIFKAMRSMREN